MGPGGGVVGNARESSSGGDEENSRGGVYSMEVDPNRTALH